MSALLRALMGQQTGGDKPNLAVITENEFDADSLTVDKTYECGVTAKVVAGKSYRLQFMLDIDITEFGPSGKICNVGSYVFWREQRLAGPRAPFQIKSYHIDYDEVRKCFYDDPNGEKLSLLELRLKYLKAHFKISNLIVTEE